MGHRANFVIVKSGSASAYYSQWAALGCTYEFAEGPEHAVRCAESCDPTEELLDWAFAEAGYLIDYDNSVAIVFGYPEIDFGDDFMNEVDPDDVASAMATSRALEEGPEQFLKLIAPKWGGWELRWDNHGVDAFAGYLQSLSIDSVRVQPKTAPKEREVASLKA